MTDMTTTVEPVRILEDMTAGSNIPGPRQNVPLWQLTLAKGIEALEYSETLPIRIIQDANEQEVDRWPHPDDELPKPGPVKGRGKGKGRKSENVYNSWFKDTLAGQEIEKKLAELKLLGADNKWAEAQKYTLTKEKNYGIKAMQQAKAAVIAMQAIRMAGMKVDIVILERGGRTSYRPFRVMDKSDSPDKDYISLPQLLKAHEGLAKFATTDKSVGELTKIARDKSRQPVPGGNDNGTTSAAISGENKTPIVPIRFTSMKDQVIPAITGLNQFLDDKPHRDAISTLATSGESDGAITYDAVITLMKGLAASLLPKSHSQDKCREAFALFLSTLPEPNTKEEPVIVIEDKGKEETKDKPTPKGKKGKILVE